MPFSPVPPWNTPQRLKFWTCSQKIILWWWLVLSISKIDLSMQAQLPLTPWYIHFSDLRWSSIIKLSWLRVGHNRLPPHLFRIRLIDSPFCPSSISLYLQLQSPFFSMPSPLPTQTITLFQTYQSQTQHPSNCFWHTNTRISLHNVHIFHLIFSILSSLLPEITT